jgi:hypothetical protein
LVDGTVQSKRDVVIFNTRGRIEIDERLNTHGIRERDFSALQFIAGSGDSRAAFGD